MGLSDLSKQLDDRKQTSTKEQPYAMGRQTVRKSRTDLTNKDFEASIKLKTMPAVKWLEVQFPPVFVQEINQYIDDVVNFQHQLLGHMYYVVDYVNKESKDIDYTTYNIGATIGWFKAGASFKDIDGEISPLLNLALSTKLKQKDLEYNVGVSVKSNITDYNIVNVKSEIKKWLRSEERRVGKECRSWWLAYL